MMNKEENLEYNECQRLINTVEYLSQAEYELCLAWLADETSQHLYNIGDDRWLNVNVYSEVSYHDRAHRMECVV
jgi:hypothetical protein